MLWYKMWRESWIRFAVSAVALLWMCGLVVLLQRQVRAHADEPMSYTHYIWSAVYKANVLDLFILLAIVVGLGGVLQERSQGTAGFTLSLPVSRWRLIAVRAATGLAQVAILALLPGLLISLLSPFVGEVFPLSRAFQFGLLWAGCGMVIFAMSFFFSVVLPGSYSPAIASVAGLLACSALAHLPMLERYPPLDLLKTMHGEQLSNIQGDASLASFAVPLPWLSLGLYALVALCLMWAAGRVMAHRDF
jgi:ABC-type transport system involved in multi-copper enzyme maturation permease subunit